VVDAGTSEELLPFQEEEIAPILERKRGMLAWDMGLGKTAGASTIGARAQLHRWLVICSDNAFSVWRDEAPRWIKRWWPDVTVRVEFIDGDRETQWATPYDVFPNVVHIRIVRIDTFLADWGVITKTGLKGKRAKTIRLNERKGYHIPEILIYDECRRIRNKETQAFEILSRWIKFYSPPWLILMTGTPGHEPKHFWTYLHLINPHYFRSYWNFVYAFHQVDDGFFGKEVNEPRNLPEWYALRKRMISVVREDDPRVIDQRPPLTRQLLEITPDADQQRLYKAFREEMMLFIEEDQKLLYAQNELGAITRIRQALICPKILSPSLSYGAAIQDFANTIEPGEHVVIFTPFTSAQPLFEEYLRTKKFNHIYTLYGSMGTTARDKAIAEYRQNKGVMICSILYAQAFSLEPATKAFFIGYDWDPDNNRQAEKRLHRLTTKTPIAAYYYAFRTTFDANLADIVNLKQRRVNITIPSEVRKVLHGEA